MNKKILFSILLFGILVAPALVLGQGDGGKAAEVADNVRALAVAIGLAIVVIGWVIAGILYLTAAGDPSKLKIAKNAMIAAIIGTILVIIAQFGYDTIKEILNSALGIEESGA